MKKLIFAAFAAVLSAQLIADDVEGAKKDETPQREERKQESTLWPSFFAICEWPASPDVVGLRLTLPFSTRQENVTGLDVGLWGRSLYFEGIQINAFHNDVKDAASGIQIGLYNSVGRGDLFGVQVGLWNEALSVRGVQVGLVNVVGETEGFQIGVINRAETMHGYQVGLINIIREAEIQFCPVLNIGF